MSLEAGVSRGRGGLGMGRPNATLGRPDECGLWAALCFDAIQSQKK
jgi:hypothetical protein